jgi:hypothetical protein
VIDDDTPFLSFAFISSSFHYVAFAGASFILAEGEERGHVVFIVDRRASILYLEIIIDGNGGSLAVGRFSEEYTNLDKQLK